MEELVFKSEKGTPATNSLLVAQKFGKEHKDVLDTVRNLTAENSAVKSLFYETTYCNEQSLYVKSFMNFGMKNKSCIFAATSPRSFFRHEIAVAIFMTVCLLSAKDKRLSIHNGLLHSCRNLTLASSWRDSLSSLYTLIFS
jgi:hypothetical protein